MISLHQYINRDLKQYSNIRDPFIIDGHIHLFGDKWILSEDKLIRDINVGFFDIEPLKVNEYNDIPEQYDAFIKNGYRSQDILLATAVTSEDMIEIHRRHPDIIQGFGEIKAYHHFGTKTKEGNATITHLLSDLSRYDEIKKYAREQRLPIYIHYTIRTPEDARTFEEWIQDAYKIVLCHYGMDNHSDNEQSFHLVRDLMKRNKNLYSEATWKSLNFFFDDPSEIMSTDLDRMIIGSDLNNTYFDFHPSSKVLKRKLDEVGVYMHSDKVLERIFNKKIK